MGACVVAIAVLGGCIVPSSGSNRKGPDGLDGGATVNGPTYRDLTVRWSIQAADGAAAACPTNYGKIAVAAAAVDGTGYRAGRRGDPLVAVFDCTAKQGTLRLPALGDEPFVENGDGTRTTTLLDGTKTTNRSPIRGATGQWRVTLYVTEPSGQLIRSPTFTQDVDLFKGDAAVDFVVNPAAGRMVDSWRIRAKSNLQDMSCAAGGVDTIRVTRYRTRAADYTEIPSPKPIVSTYACDATYESYPDCSNCVGAGVSGPLEYGWYTAKVEALAGNQVLGTNDAFDQSQERHVDENTVAFSLSGGGDFNAFVLFGESRTAIVNNR
jgi:hypothetical protein